VRKYVLQGVVSTLAGAGKPGFKDGLLATATFNQKAAAAVALEIAE
jgi:hypothetical protein